MGGVAKPGALSRLPKVVDLDVVDLRLGAVRTLDGLKLVPATADLLVNGDQFVDKIATPSLPESLLALDQSSVAALYTDVIVDPSILSVASKQPTLNLRQTFDRAIASTLPWVHRLLPLAPHVAEISSLLAAGITSLMAGSVTSFFPILPIGIGTTKIPSLRGEGLHRVISKAVHSMYDAGSLLTYTPPNPEKMMSYLFSVAASMHTKVETHEHALIYFDQQVKSRGFQSLETYIMLHFGYRASATLPDNMRRHKVPELDQRFGEQPRLSETIGSAVDHWVNVIFASPRLTSADLPIRDQLAYKIARLELLHPELRGHLTPFDFDFIRGEPLLIPNPTRAAELRKILGDKVTDLFPEFELDPNLPEAKLLDPLREFLMAFRSAERLFDRGSEYDHGKRCAHCNDSARRVVRVFRAKGFEAFMPETLRFSTHKKLFDYEFGDILTKLVEGTGINLNGAKKILDRIVLYKEGHDPSILDGILLAPEAIEISQKPAIIDLIYNRIQALGKFDAAVFRMGRDNWHRIAVVKLGKRYYLIDINQQQFGGPYDELVLIPEEVAFRAGIHTLSPIPPEKTESPFLLPSRIHDELRAIRQYMIVQGSISGRPKR